MSVFATAFFWEALAVMIVYTAAVIVLAVKMARMK